MNIDRQRYITRAGGTTLIEVLVYMALFVVVVGFAVAAFFGCWDNTKKLRRDADDVARALDIGERWRADVRGATGAVELTAANGTEQFRIPAAAGDITYTSANGEIHRQAGSSGPETLWLANVKSSQMQSEARGSVAAWRWELELKSARREARTRPLFTFESAAGKGASQ
jgi:Tfp pilus assembly protein FimT